MGIEEDIDNLDKIKTDSVLEVPQPLPSPLAPDHSSSS
jgi:hypothetical protein